MYTKPLGILATITFLCGALTFFAVTRGDDANVITAVTPVTYPTATFISAETNDTISVRFLDTEAILDGAGYRDVLFVSVEAASGAKYESKENNLTLWQKGNEITLSRGRQILFVGVDVDQKPFEDSSGEVGDVATVPDASQATTTVVEEEIPNNERATSSDLDLE
jgi:membrane-bound inhibitor of C-type lysozyme